MDVQSPPTLITLSFSGDLDCCRLLCETADRFAPAGAAHLLAVPAAAEPLKALLGVEAEPSPTVGELVLSGGLAAVALTGTVALLLARS